MGILKVRRPLSAASILAALVFSATCGDNGPAGPPLAAGHAQVALKPSFAKLPAGAPSVPLSKIKGVLTGPTGESQTAEAKFVNGEAALEFEVTISGMSAVFELLYTAYDLQGVVAYTGRQTITLHAGRNPSVPSPVLVYDAPDAKVTTIRVSPGTMTLQAGGSATLGVTGTLSNGQTLTPRVGWASSNPNVATVNTDGVVTAGRSQGSATITATAANGLTASATIKVQAPVDKVTITPPTATIVRGQTTNATVDLRDATNVVIDDRTATWTSSDPSVATVSATGVITAVGVGKATITATSEGKTGTTTVTVISPLDKIDLSPTTVAFAALKSTQGLTARLVPVANASTAGITVNFTSSNASAATVDSKGVITAIANGTTRITAEAEGKTATADVTVQQVAVALNISPRAASVNAIGASTTFSTTIADAGGTNITNPVIVWTSSDPTIATVVGNGTTAIVTSKRGGSVTITAATDGKTDAVTFIVAPQGNLLLVNLNKAQIQVGQTATATAVIADLNGNPIGPAPSAVLSTSTPNTISVSSGVVAGLSPGVGVVVATLGTMTASTGITVVPAPGEGGGGGTTLVPDSVEKLPGGTQQFTTPPGMAGPFTWTVNGINGGNATYGTITVQGFYAAPLAVPSPSKFPVCAVPPAPAAPACAKVVISPIPTSGNDVIVFNDVNVFDSPGSGDLNNQQMWRNLVNYTSTGPRAKQTGVMYYNGHNSAYYSGFPTLTSIVTAAGFTVTTFSEPLTSPIAANIKVLFLWLPTTTFNLAEINVMKAFSADGGRIVFVGEHGQYYGAGIPIENNFFLNMGAKMTNTGGLIDCGFVIEPAASLRPYQVTAGLTQLTVACASEVVPGPNDYPFLYDITNTRVIAAAAKVDVTPSVVLLSMPAPKGRPVVTDGILRDLKDPAGRPLPNPPVRPATAKAALLGGRSVDSTTSVARPKTP